MSKLDELERLKREATEHHGADGTYLRFHEAQKAAWPALLECARACKAIAAQSPIGGLGQGFINRARAAIAKLNGDQS